MQSAAAELNPPIKMPGLDGPSLKLSECCELTIAVCAAALGTTSNAAAAASARRRRVFRSDLSPGRGGLVTGDSLAWSNALSRDIIAVPV
jgi:hypothetical protein